MKLIKRIFVVLAMLCATQVFAVEQGKDYKLLSPAQPTRSGNKVEVLEFFFYGCIHCYHLHPALSAWEKTMPKDVQLTYVPTVFNDQWEPMSYTFYALEAMHQRKPQLDDALYNAWNVDKIYLTDEAKIAAFLSQHGVDGNKFGEFYNSFSVESDVRRGKQMQKSYNIMGTPTLIVDGKYVVEAQANPDDTIRILNAVIEKARKERGRH